MKAILSYLFQIVLVSGILYSYYHFVLQNKKFHQYNRVYLLVTALLSLIIPLLHFDLYFTTQEEIPVVYQMIAEVKAGDVIHANQTAFFNWQNLFKGIYCLASLLLLARLIF